MEIGAGSARDVTTDEIEQFRGDGWVVLRNLIPSNVVARTLSVAQGQMGLSAESSDFASRGARYAAWSNPSGEVEWLREVSQSADLGRVASNLAGGREMRWYGDSVMAKRGVDAGGDRTPWHQDYPQHAFDRAGGVTLWIPLVDCPAERGTLRFLSGSHRAGPLGRFGRRADGAARVRDAVDTYPDIAHTYPQSPGLDLAVGDATAHNILTVHSAPPNETDDTRWAYSITWFPAETLYTGANSHHTNGLNMTVDAEFDDNRFPVVTGARRPTTELS